MKRRSFIASFAARQDGMPRRTIDPYLQMYVGICPV